MISKARLRRKLNAVKQFWGVMPEESAPLGHLSMPHTLHPKYIGATTAPFCFNCDIFTEVDLHGDCKHCGKSIKYVERANFFPELMDVASV